MDTQFDSLMSSGTPNCWTMCPWGHVTILLAVPSGQGPCWLCVPYSWPWLTRQALLREPAGRHVSPGQRALAAAGCWRLQAGPHCDAGPSCARPAPAGGHAPPCVTLASLAHLISLGEGSDSA